MDKKVLICRTDSIGDVILTLPLCGFLKNKGFEVYFLGRSYTKAVVESSNNIEEFIDIDAYSRPSLIDKIKSLKIDIGVLVYPTKEISSLLKRSKIPKRVGTSHRLYNWLFCNRLVSFSRKNSDLHEAQLNFKLLKPLGISSIPELDDLKDFYGYQTIKKEEPNNIINVILHPKSKGSARDWPLEHYLELVKISINEPIHFYISGTKGEAEKIKRERPDLLIQKNVTDVTGKYNLEEFISFIKAKDAIVACSTGPAHIGASNGIHAIGIYPPIKPMHPRRWKPIGKDVDVLVKQKQCVDCRNGGACKCIIDISPKDVLDKILRK